MSALKVLTFGWELAPVLTGGLGVVCRDLTDALVEKNVEVSFVVPKFPSDIVFNDFKLINASTYRIDPARYYEVDSHLKFTAYGDYIPQQKFQLLSKTPTFDKELYGSNLLLDVENYAISAQEIVKNIDCDVIHCHDWMTGVAGLRAKKILNKPLVVHVHSTEYDRSANSPYDLIKNYEQMIFDGADKIIAISEFTKNIVVEKYHINPNKISIVHNAINSTNEIPNKISLETVEEKVDKTKNVLFLARLTVQKGADYLLKAAQKVLAKRKNVRFIIVGSGPMLKKLIDLSFELGIENNVVFAGALNHNQVDDAYKQADLFVMPSVSEPFGITALESIKNGTPVLLSKQSGASEVIQNALKVDFWDVDAMAGKIISVIEHEPLAETLKDNGFHDLNKLTWSNQADKVIEVYLQTIRDYKA